MAGRLVHFELPAEDTARAQKFYEDLFGWSFQSWEGPVEYRMTDGLEPGGAIYRSQEGERDPIVYFETEDIDATIGRIRELGGEAEDKMPIPTIGWMTRAKDTEGNSISLFQSDESAAPPEG